MVTALHCYSFTEEVDKAVTVEMWNSNTATNSQYNSNITKVKVKQQVILKTYDNLLI